MMKPKVVVFDYGCGNLRSAQRALEHVGGDVVVTADHTLAGRAAGLVLPGVGAFASCMDGIDAVGGREVVARRVDASAALLGICVGAQVLFSSGVEHGERAAGLDVFHGEVSSVRAERIPHMGWNTVDPGGISLFDGIDAESRFYFVHSYAAHPPVPDANVAVCDYGEPFVAAIERGQVAATQFHPEKSGEAGLALLSNWVRSLQ